MKRSLLFALALSAATVLLIVPGTVAAPDPQAGPGAVEPVSAPPVDASELLAPDPHLGASEIDAGQTELCNRCRAHPLCSVSGVKCGKEVGGPCYCRVCNGAFDCWQGRN